MLKVSVDDADDVAGGDLKTTAEARPRSVVRTTTLTGYAGDMLDASAAVPSRLLSSMNTISNFVPERALDNRSTRGRTLSFSL
jgi:hypothetical protein